MDILVKRDWLGKRLLICRKVIAILYKIMCNTKRRNKKIENEENPRLKAQKQKYEERQNIKSSILTPEVVLNRVYQKGQYAQTSIEKYEKDFYTENSLKNARVAYLNYLYNEMPVQRNMVF